MNFEQQLKLQAHLDGELSIREAAEVAGWLESNPEAQALLGELSQMRAALKANEPEIQVPDTREFYWSKIQREIVRVEQAEERVVADAPAVSWWRRYWAPLSGVAVTASLMVLTLNPFVMSPSLVEEMENPLDEASTVTFRAEKERTTIVWLVSQANDDSPDAADMDDSEETVPQ